MKMRSKKDKNDNQREEGQSSIQPVEYVDVNIQKEGTVMFVNNKTSI